MHISEPHCPGLSCEWGYHICAGWPLQRGKAGPEIRYGHIYRGFAWYTTMPVEKRGLFLVHTKTSVVLVMYLPWSKGQMKYSPNKPNGLTGEGQLGVPLP